MRTEHAIAIIPARGGSKGIPRKNVIQVGGQPLILWSVIYAKAVCERVVVSTDSSTIWNLVKDEAPGVEIHARSTVSATDDAPSEIALIEAIDWLGCDDEQTILFLQATSPLRVVDDLARAIKTVARGGADSVFSARPVVGYTWLDHSGSIIPLYHERRMRQAENQRVIEETGSFYAFTAGGLRRHQNRLHGRILPIFCHPLTGYQIDEPADIALMDTLFLIRGGIQ